MDFPFVAEAAIFIERPNRFVVRAQLKDTGEVIRAHCADPGRLRDLLVPGAQVFVSRANPRPNRLKERKTNYDLRLVRHPVHAGLISLDTRVPNILVADALERRQLSPFGDYAQVNREVSLVGPNGVRSRIDFQLTGFNGAITWIEVKSATLVVNERALFPDAVTERGRRHVEKLAQRSQAPNERSAIVFVVQRSDAGGLAPHWQVDPKFARALVRAQEAGVELLAYTCNVTVKKIELARQVPVSLGQDCQTVSQC